MAGKKQDNEDTRDVFEKALDIALPTTAGIGGAMLGGKIARKLSGLRKPQVVMRELREAHAAKPKDMRKIGRLEEEARFSGHGLPYFYGGTAGFAGGSQAGKIYLQSLEDGRNQGKKTRRK